ncbi:MAG: hypothetical protein LC135_00630 [Phycisphaerae bacterium]|nr:hypothetical protein [Phycisphaerae bacterium]MCZ2398357.1 hypothetical protein [Phycisphaerae bacterium]
MWRRIICSLLLAVAVYALLVSLWPAARHALTPPYCAVGNLLFQRFGSYGTVRLTALRPAPEDREVQARLTAAAGRMKGEVSYSLRELMWAPLASFLALALATPLPRRRLLVAVGVGLVLMCGYVTLRTQLKLWTMFEQAAPRLSEGRRAALATVHGALVETPGSHYTAAILVWAVVSFRRGDVARLLAASAPPGAAASGG